MSGAIRDALASHDWTFEVGDRLHENDRHLVHAVTVDGSRAVCKAATGPGADPGREAEILYAVGDRTPVPVPDVLASSPEHYVLSWCDGAAYDGDAPRGERAARLRAVGETLARLHDATEGWFDGHGPVRAADRSLRSAGDAWPAVCRRRAERVAAGVEGTRHADLGEAVAEAVTANEHLLADRQPVLVHGDLDVEHVRFDADEVTCVIDWERASAAPGVVDLVRAELGLIESPHSPETDGDLRTALHDGYASVRPLPDGFERRRTLFRALRTLELLPGTVDAAASGRIDADPELIGETLAAFVRERLADLAGREGGVRQ